MKKIAILALAITLPSLLCAGTAMNQLKGAASTSKIASGLSALENSAELSAKPVDGTSASGITETVDLSGIDASTNKVAPSYSKSSIPNLTVSAVEVSSGTPTSDKAEKKKQWIGGSVGFVVGAALGFLAAGPVGAIVLGLLGLVVGLACTSKLEPGDYDGGSYYDNHPNHHYHNGGYYDNYHYNGGYYNGGGYHNGGHPNGGHPNGGNNNNNGNNHNNGNGTYYGPRTGGSTNGGGTGHRK